MSNAMRIGALIGGGLVALACSLSAHALMLDHLHVPSPHLPHSAWVRLPDHLMQTASLIAIYLLLSHRLRSSPRRAFLVLLLVMLTVTETLFRDPFMEVVNNSNLTLYPFVDVGPLYLTAATVVVGIVAARRFLARWPGRLAVCALVGGVAYLIVAPVVGAAFAPVQAWTMAREGFSVYNPPYDWHILVPAYLTFAEPVIGAFLVCFLISPRLPVAHGKQWAALALIVFALRGVFFSCFIYIPFAPVGPITALLSEGQFTLENLLLASVVAATWVLVPGARSLEERRA